MPSDSIRERQQTAGRLGSMESISPPYMEMRGMSSIPVVSSDYGDETNAGFNVHASPAPGASHAEAPMILKVW